MITVLAPARQVNTLLIGADLVTDLQTHGPLTLTTLSTPGPQGAPGAIGPGFDPNDYFQTALLFSELDTAQKKVDARANLELQYIDCGTFN